MRLLRLTWTLAHLALTAALFAACGDISAPTGSTPPSEPPAAVPRVPPPPSPAPAPAPTPTPAPPPSPTSASPCSVIGAAPSRSTVVNGDACPGGASPIVLVNVRNSSGGINFTCSGTVVGARAVLTAGHCLAGAAAADIDLGGTDVAGASLHVSPGYHSDGPTSEDVALLLTTQNLPRPAFPILASRDPNVGEQAVVAGFGLDENGAGGMLRAGYNAISRVGAYYIETLFVPGGNSGLCKGDSGAPLLVYQVGWAVAGVASSISGSCTAAGTDSFASLRNADTAAFVASLVPDLARR